MARLLIRGGEVVVRMNPLEKLMDLRLRSPRFDIKHISRCTVVGKVWDDALEAPSGVSARRSVDLGRMREPGVSGAAYRVATVTTRAKFGSAGAIVIAYGNRTGVVLDVPRSATRWSLVVVTERAADRVAAAIRSAK